MQIEIQSTVWRVSHSIYLLGAAAVPCFFQEAHPQKLQQVGKSRLPKKVVESIDLKSALRQKIDPRW